MNFRKGFYFSFDAFLALSVMSATLVVVAQSPVVSPDSLEIASAEYEQVATKGRDAMKIASRQEVKALEESFQQELVSQTVMEEEDLNRTVVDGISLLWAARNFSYAEEATQRYFDSYIPEGYGYRLEVSEDGSTKTIYETSSDEGAKAVSSISRLVSGHKIDRPSEGFRARARALESRENQTKVVTIPMAGSGGENLRLLLNKSFRLNATEIHDAKLFFSAQWGESNFNSNEVLINGQAVDIGGNNDGDWKYLKEKGAITLGYDTADVTSEVKEGWNNFYLNFNNQNNDQIHINPGAKLKITYTAKKGFEPGRGKKRYLMDVESEGGNKNKRGGAWITKSFYVPEDSELREVYLRLHAKNVRDTNDPDVEVYINEDRVFSQDLSGDKVFEVNLTSQAERGTNVVSAYINTEVENGEVTGLEGYPENPEIYSDPVSNPENSSLLYVDQASQEELKFGEIEVVTTERAGGLAKNPKSFEDELEEDKEVSNLFLNIAQLDTVNVTSEAGADSLETFFTSPRDFAVPTRIGVDTDILEAGEQNTFNVSDSCDVKCLVLPQTGIEKHIFIPSQVGYGEFFSNRSTAVDDAEQRLIDLLGEYSTATEIATGTVSTGSQPYLWGPAQVKLVMWRE